MRICNSLVGWCAAIAIGALAALLSSAHSQLPPIPGGAADTAAGFASTRFASPIPGTAGASFCPLVRLLTRQ